MVRSTWLSATKLKEPEVMWRSAYMIEWADF